MTQKTTKSYAGRKVDISLNGVLIDNPVETLNVDGRFRYVTGHIMAVQNFIRALLTPLGHFKSSPEFGSNLLSEISPGNKLYPDDLPNTFAIESLRVIEYLFETKGNEVPDDEVIEVFSKPKGKTKTIKIDFMVKNTKT